MFDTIKLRLNREEVKGTDLLSEIPNYFEVTSESMFQTGPSVSGYIDNLKVTVNERGVKVGNGSLCKYYLGDNLQTIGRKDTQKAIEKISDTLHLPFDRAHVTRLDIAQNLILKHPLPVYFNHLGPAQYYTRFEQPDSIYYSNKKRRLIFYNKVKEVTAKREPVPELYRGRNALRFEMRLEKRLREQLKRPEVKASLLFDEKFYIELIDWWYNEYQNIQKINEMQTDLTKAKTKKDLYQIGLLALVEKEGGPAAIQKKIDEMFQSGLIDRFKKRDLKQAVKDALTVGTGQIESEAIKELDQKMKQAVRFYR
ncbi:MAG: hypothetical protein JG782_996 [Anaerophaga sp.]|nr:hypothetical protein [Anaerophaga sp.]